MPTWLRWLRRTFPVRPEEWRIAGALFGYFFLLTALHNLLKPARNSLFLSTAGAENLPWAYIASAFVSAAATLAYGRWVARFSRGTQILGSLAFVAVTLVGFEVVLRDPGSWIAGAFYVWVNLFTLLLVSQFFLVGNALFDPRQAKRLFGFIGAGGLAGGIAGGASASAMVEPLGTSGLLWIGVAILIACSGLVSWVLRTGRFHAIEPERASVRLEEGLGGGIQALRRVPHLRMIAMLLFATVLVSTFVDWMFNDAVERVITTQEERTQFFGYAFALFNAVAFTLQVFLASFTLRTLGLAGSLVLLPMAMGAGVAGVVLVPGLWAATIAKGADATLRNSIDQSARELLYLPVPTVLKQRVKPFIDIVVTRGADGVAGALILLGIGVASIDPRGFGLVTLGLVAGWMVVVVGVRRTYRRALERILAVRDVDLEAAAETSLDPNTLQDLREELRPDVDAPIVEQALDFVETLPPGAMRDEVLGLLDHPDSDVRARAVRYLIPVADARIAEEVRRLLEDRDTRVRAEAMRLLCEVEPDAWLDEMEKHLEGEDEHFLEVAIASLMTHGDADTVSRAGDAVSRLVRTTGVTGAPGRLAAARALGRVPGSHPLQRHLVTLLEDPNAAVRRAAIASAGSTPGRDRLDHLLPHLESRDTRSGARRALAAHGEEALPDLAAAMRDPDLTLEVRRWIPGVFVEIGTPAAYRTLLDGLPTLEIGNHRLYALKALNKLRRRHPGWDLEPEIARSELERELEESYDLERQLATLRAENGECEREGNALEAYADALSWRATKAIERAFRLQGLLYPTQTIYYAYTGLTGGDTLRAAHAIELLETVLDREDAARLVPLIDPDNDPSRRVEIGRRWYSLEPRPVVEDLERVLEAGEPWQQAYAVALGGEERYRERLGPEIARLAASGAPIVRALARRIVETDGEEEGEKMPMSSIEKAAALRRADLLSELGAEDLLQLGAVAEEREFERGETLFYEGEEGDYMYVILEGRVRADHAGQTVAEVESGESIGTFSILDRRPRSASVIAQEPTRTLALHRADMAQILADNYSLVEGLFEYLTRIIRRMNDELRRAHDEDGASHTSAPVPDDPISQS